MELTSEQYVFIFPEPTFVKPVILNKCKLVDYWVKLIIIIFFIFDSSGDPQPQRLQTALGLYSNDLCGIVLLTDTHIGSHTGLLKGISCFHNYRA